MFQNSTILLVEDNIDMQEYMKLLLEDECKQLFFAANGAEGLMQYKHNKPDLIITDLNMPMMDGIEMGKEIKMKDYTQPIILLTAHGDIEELQEAINIGLNAFISKPIENIEILFNTMKKLLNSKREVGLSKREHIKEKIRETRFVNDILHNDQEYVDYESLVKDTNWK